MKNRMTRMANKGMDLRGYVGERVRGTGAVAKRGGVQGIAPEKVEKL